ncbi:unnamed protein product [Rotaria socialis]|uniref:Transmembrane protein 53 n=1 Tax=Rotaria socialis TaxID=392032 RepID=A0A818MAU0_9BILA|nr:unnamed protein product [Rotaria socialis]CAF3445121.1 unnamed protein product [Rotaria socialis]CAF3482918.1 unnamed protein product [Rotaria socialis]CAF3578420.1 unnamed protein product [Rotaria socialis]CAF3584295.1 unnamed protein product [Rotaria socialis]
MLIQISLPFGIVVFAAILYQIADHYARRYLGFNSTDHIPICKTGSSSAPALVCVLGWGGCQRRQLRRLLDFYSSHNISTVSWINPMFNCLLGIDTKQVERVLDFLLHENRTSKKVIIIHIHSNNGTLVWSRMLNIMMTNEHYHQLLPNIKGIIFDSAPFVRLHKSSDWIIESAVGTTKACVSIILNRAQYFHVFWTPLITYYLCIRFFYKRYFSSDPSSSGKILRELLNTMPTDIKQYYLYSNGDRLIPSYSIEQCMARQVERGVQVSSHRFIDSGHVNHFRLHPEEYGRLILDFIVKI